jgi:hypothetical protein
MDIEFTELEQTILREAQAEAEIATQKLEALQRQALDAQGILQQTVGGYRKAIRTILQLLNLNPDAYEVSVNSNGSIQCRPVHKSDEPEGPSNLVLPTPT